jgi:hypothetical protein
LKEPLKVAIRFECGASVWREREREREESMAIGGEKGGGGGRDTLGRRCGAKFLLN